jgi:hypothetical protein
VRRSWLWLLAAQGLVAGIGHGIVVAKATGSAVTGWWRGAGEFVLETVTWVGGAYKRRVGDRAMDTGGDEPGAELAAPQRAAAPGRTAARRERGHLHRLGLEAPEQGGTRGVARWRRAGGSEG